MREAAFIKQNTDKWRLIEQQPARHPDVLAEQFIELTDDLAYARTFYPESGTTQYLNHLAGKLHQSIYQNKRQKSNRFVTFWLYELPLLMASAQKPMLYSFIIFTLAALLGALSAAYDDTFVRLILGDAYVNATLANIERGDPMAVYKQAGETVMFLGITLNNIKVAFIAFIMGVFISLGTGYILFSNGVMLGAFQYFFYQKGLLATSVLTIWIHGTLEISAIIIAGAAGIVMGNSILFPKTFSRIESFKKGARKGLKMVVGLVPIFITAGFLEGFVTRHTDMPLPVSLFIILGSLAFILFYFIWYPIYLTKPNLLKHESTNDA